MAKCIFHYPSQAVQPAEPCFLQPAGSSWLIMLSSSLALIVSVIPIIIDKLSCYMFLYVFICSSLPKIICEPSHLRDIWDSDSRTEDRLKLMQAAADPKAALGLSGDCGDPLGWGLANITPFFFFDLFAVFTMFYHVFTPLVNLCQSNLRRGTLSNGKSLVQFFWIETVGFPVPVQHVGHTVAHGILKMVNCINCNLPTPSVQI